MPCASFRWLPLLACVSGCVVVYQPLSGLHRPVVVDPQAPNLAGLRITVHCVPGELLSHDRASVLCQKVGALFENQGAAVTTLTSSRGALDTSLAETPSGDAPAESGPADLVVELRARELRQSNDSISWALCVLSFTLVPGVTESTFAQSVVIRDGSGFLLARDSLEGRIVRRFGAGTWVGNKLLDLVWRDDDEDLTGDVVERDLSSDLYRQLSQQVFDASRRRQVLLQVSPPAAAVEARP